MSLDKERKDIFQLFLAEKLNSPKVYVLSKIEKTFLVVS